MLFLQSIENRLRSFSAGRLRWQFFDLQRQIKPDLFVELGAYDGSTSLEMRGILPDARIVSFEANPRCYSRFSAQQNFRAAGVEYLHFAVASEPGERTFNMLNDRDGVSKKGSLLSRTAQTRQEPITVPATSLDSFFEEFSGRASLWVDVEGASGDVFAGASRFLRHVESALVEVEEKSFWEGQWLAKDVVAHLATSGLRPVGRDYEYPHQYNIMFRR